MQSTDVVIYGIRSSVDFDQGLLFRGFVGTVVHEAVVFVSVGARALAAPTRQLLVAHVAEAVQVAFDLLRGQASLA